MDGSAGEAIKAVSVAPSRSAKILEWRVVRPELHLDSYLI